MKKAVLLLILLACFSTTHAAIVEVSCPERIQIEPNERVEISLEITNTSGTKLQDCRAIVDVELLGDEIEHFTILSEPTWEIIATDASVNGKIKIKMSADTENILFTIPIIVSGKKGTCAGGCVPFAPQGPFYVEIHVRNHGLLRFNQAESLYNEEKYQEAKEKYQEAKSYFLKYTDKTRAQRCLTEITRCDAYIHLNNGISYFDSDDRDSAKEEFEEAKSLFKELDDGDMVATCEEWITKCETPPPTTTAAPTTTAPPSTTVPTTVAPTTTAPTTTSPPTTSEPSSTNPVVLGALVAAIVAVVAVTVKIVKK